MITDAEYRILARADRNRTNYQPAEEDLPIARALYDRGLLAADPAFPAVTQITMTGEDALRAESGHRSAIALEASQKAEIADYDRAERQAWAIAARKASRA